MREISALFLSQAASLPGRSHRESLTKSLQRMNRSGSLSIMSIIFSSLGQPVRLGRFRLTHGSSVRSACQFVCGSFGTIKARLFRDKTEVESAFMSAKDFVRPFWAFVKCQCRSRRATSAPFSARSCSNLCTYRRRANLDLAARLYLSKSRRVPPQAERNGPPALSKSR
jgi:hypothetical protein